MIHKLKILETYIREKLDFLETHESEEYLNKSMKAIEKYTDLTYQFYRKYGIDTYVKIADELSEQHDALFIESTQSLLKVNYYF